MVAVLSGLVHAVGGGREESPTPIPLISVNVIASVVQAVGQVEVTQVYVNKEIQPIEAIYYFPINPEGAVTHFEAELEGRTIKGIVKENQKARADYDKAVKGQKTAFLGEEIKSDIFKLRVGFLRPGNQVKVKIGYVTEVKNEPGSNSIRFYIPTTITPRYVSPSETGATADDIRRMRFSRWSPAPLSLKVVVSLQGGIRSIKSPTHSVQVDKVRPIPQSPEWHMAMVKLSGETTDMDRDFVLNILPEEVHKPRMYSEKRQDGSIAAMVHLVPSFKLDDLKTELYFVLDRSGSMDGESIKLARKALLLFLHSMPADCYFNVVGFGSSYGFLFPTATKYRDKSLSTAMHYAKTLQADMGGTEILEPLKAIYATPTIRGYLRQIFILTDGEVSNTEDVIGIAQENAHHARVFALGIGDGASHALVDGVAKAGGGTSAFVTYNESFDTKVLNQLKNAIQPSLTDIQLKWQSPVSKSVKINKVKTLLGYNKPIEPEGSTHPAGKGHRQSPRKIPAVYDGSQMLVFGLFQNECPPGVTIKAQSPDGPLTLEITTHSNMNTIGFTTMLHHLAAVKLVRELELEVAALSFKGGSHAVNDAKQLEKEIVEISCKNGITSKYTSFVAVDAKDHKASSESWVMQSRHVPQQIGHGWHGTSSPVRRVLSTYSDACDHLSYADDSSPESNHEFGVLEHCAEACYIDTGCERARSTMSSKSSVNSIPSSPLFLRKRCDFGDDDHYDVMSDDDSTPLDDLISLQSFDGSYSLNLELSNIIGKPLPTLKAGAAKQGLDEHVFATALAIVFFETKMTHEKAVWELIVRKARKWLSKWIRDDGDQVNFVLQTASSFL